MGMRGKRFLLGLVLCCGLQGQSLRWREVCEIQAPKESMFGQMMGGNCEREVLARDRQQLIRRREGDLLDRILPDGRIETISIHHEDKTWNVVRDDDREMAAFAQGYGGQNGAVQFSVGEALPERVIAGRKAKGSSVKLQFDAAKLAAAFGRAKPAEEAKAVPAEIAGMGIEVEIWSSEGFALPQILRGTEFSGVGAKQVGTDSAVSKMATMFGASPAVVAKLRSVGSGLPLESTNRFRMPQPDGMGKLKVVEIVQKIRAVEISQEEIREKVFAIPEGYRRVE